MNDVENEKIIGVPIDLSRLDNYTEIIVDAKGNATQQPNFGEMFDDDFNWSNSQNQLQCFDGDHDAMEENDGVRFVEKSEKSDEELDIDQVIESLSSFIDKDTLDEMRDVAENELELSNDSGDVDDADDTADPNNGETSGADDNMVDKAEECGETDGKKGENDGAIDSQEDSDAADDEEVEDEEEEFDDEEDGDIEPDEFGEYPYRQGRLLKLPQLHRELIDEPLPESDNFENIFYDEHATYEIVYKEKEEPVLLSQQNDDMDALAFEDYLMVYGVDVDNAEVVAEYRKKFIAETKNGWKSGEESSDDDDMPTHVNVTKAVEKEDENGVLRPVISINSIPIPDDFFASSVNQVDPTDHMADLYLYNLAENALEKVLLDTADAVIAENADCSAEKKESGENSENESVDMESIEGENDENDVKPTSMDLSEEDLLLQGDDADNNDEPTNFNAEELLADDDLDMDVI